jgi:NAD(P)-dependent dehydrogenase (short-subunit alcohol dehydrogenase family)
MEAPLGDWHQLAETDCSPARSIRRRTMSPLSFDGRTAIITGAGRGLGREYALLLASRGANVVVNDAGVDLEGRGNSAEPAESVVETITSAGGSAVANFDDVREAGTGKVLVEQALDGFGRLDIVINNAGVSCPRPFSEQSADDLTATVEVNLYGAAQVTQAAWPHLANAGHGRLVNTTSGTLFGAPGQSYYVMAKGGLFGFTKTLALEGADLGIKANCIAPAGWTRMAIGAAADDLLTPEMWEFAEAAMPPAVNAAVVAYLAHEGCAVSGETLSCSGGRLARLVLSETEGVEVSADLTPEEVADRLGAITDLAVLHQFTSAAEMLGHTQQKLINRTR